MKKASNKKKLDSFVPKCDSCPYAYPSKSDAKLCGLSYFYRSVPVTIPKDNKCHSSTFYLFHNAFHIFT